MHEPEQDWTPLRRAPFRYQVDTHPFSKRPLDQMAITTFLRDRLKKCPIEECGLDLENNTFAISYSRRTGSGKIKEYAEVVPYPPQQWYGATHVERVRPPKGVEQTIAATWAEMERRFRKAHSLGECRVVARVGSPAAPRFTALTSESFAAYKIIDWRNGFAEAATGDRLFCIYAAPPLNQTALFLARQFEKSPAKLAIGRWVYQNRLRDIPHKVGRALIDDIRSGTKGSGQLDEKTIRGALKLFRDFISSKPPLDLLSRLKFIDSRR